MKHIIPAALLSALLASCGGGYVKNTLKDVSTFISERPDSALGVLQSIDTVGLKGRNKADYHLLLAMALDKSYVDVASDSVVRPAVEFYGKHGPRHKRMLSLYYLGTAKYYAGDYNEAIIILDRAEELAIREKDLLYQGLANSAKSSVCTMSYNSGDELKYALKALDCYMAIPDSFQTRRALLLVANAYNNNSSYADAAAIYADLIAKYPADTFLMRRSLVRGAYSCYRADSSNLQKAMSYYDRAINEYKCSFGIDEAAHYCELCYLAGRKKEAMSILSSLEGKGTAPEHVYYLKSIMYSKEGYYRDAYQALKQFVNEEQKVVSTALNQSIIKTQRDYQIQAKKLAEETDRRQRMVNAAIMASLLLLVAASASYIIRKRKQHLADREQLLAAVGDAKWQLVSSQQRNADLENALSEARSQYVSAYKRQFQKISSLLEKYYVTSGSRNGRDEVYKHVMTLAATVGRDRDSMRALEKNVNEHLDNAMQLYREEFPEQEKDHYDFVCYLMAGFTASMIELLTGLSSTNVYTRKKRLMRDISASSAPHRSLFLLAIK